MTIRKALGFKTKLEKHSEKLKKDKAEELMKSECVQPAQAIDIDYTNDHEINS